MAVEALLPEHSFYDQNGISLYLPTPLGKANYCTGSHSSRSLKLGCLDDLQLIDNSDLRSDSTITNQYKRLNQFIKLYWGPNKTPVFIVDYHQFALYGWCEAVKEGLLKPEASIKHYDQHADASPAALAVMSPDIFLKQRWNLQEIVQYTLSLGCWEFIEPAQRMGLISQYLHLTSTHNLTRNTHSLYSSIVPFHTDTAHSIVDVDLDYFNCQLSPADQLSSIKALQRDISSAGVVTIATSPGFIQPEKAIQLIKKILN